MTRLSVNVNKIALLRNSRDTTIPSVLDSALTCIAAGAEGITVHPRPDQRHIRPSDVYELSEVLDVELNIEGNPYAGPQGDYPGFIEIARRTKPAQCTLVPDGPEQLTSDHGWDLTSDADKLLPIVNELHEIGCRVSLFMDPDVEQIRLAPSVGADRVELYTEGYASAYGGPDEAEVFNSYAEAAAAATDLGIGLNAGHDLNLVNLRKFCTIHGILEVSIGHALVADALKTGLATAVKEYLELLQP